MFPVKQSKRCRPVVVGADAHIRPLSKGLIVSRETFLKNYYFILKFIQNGDIILNVRKIL